MSRNFSNIDQASKILVCHQKLFNMAEALQGIGNLWDHLTELHHKDPKKYKEIIEDSAKEYAKMKLPPTPHTCIIAKDMVSFVICFLNLKSVLTFETLLGIELMF